MVIVPRVEAMGNKTFRRHLNARHVPAGDFANLTELSTRPESKRDRPTFEAYHKRLHETGEYDHEHE